MSEWMLEESYFFASKFRRYQKRHPDETATVMNNLDTYFRTLNAGVKPELIQAGHLHHEPRGVLAVDQRGTRGRSTETRL